MHDVESRLAMLERAFSSLVRKSGNGVAFARSTAVPVDTGSVQTIQGQMDALTVRDAMPVLFHYGFSSSMPIGGDKVINFLNGDRSSGVVVATGHQSYRIKGLANGDVAIYDMRGAYVKLTASGIVIDGAGQNLTIQNAPTVTANVSLFRVSGDIIDHYGTNANSSAAMRTIFDSHTHGGVQTGGGHTAGPDEVM